MGKIASLGVTLAPTGMAAAASAETNAQGRAQSGVTLHGIVDAGISYLKTNTGARCSLLSGGLSGNRFGLKGQEDPGAGLTAIFPPENGFAIDNGRLLQGSVPIATPGDVDNNDFSARVSDAAKDASPDYAGLRFESPFAFGGASGHIGDTGQGTTFGAATACRRDPPSIAGAARAMISQETLP